MDEPVPSITRAKRLIGVIPAFPRLVADITRRNRLNTDWTAFKRLTTTLQEITLTIINIVETGDTVNLTGEGDTLNIL